MSEQLGNLDLAALISSRICHDVINPVGAISNGLEMLAEEPDEEMRVQAMELIRNSARQAAAKLQFARLAFGAAGSGRRSIFATPRRSLTTLCKVPSTASNGRGWRRRCRRTR